MIGIGNRYRSDDAAGLEAADRLRGLVPADVEVLLLEGEPVSLLDSWDDAPAAIVIDAISSDAPPGTLLRVDARQGPLPEALGGPSTHALGLAEAIALARELDRLPASLVIYGIEAERFDAGDGLTPAVEAGVARAVEAVASELGDRP